MRTRFIGLGMLLLTGFGGTAEAARKVLIVGAGDCREPTLTTAVKQFHDEARPLLKTQLFEPDVVLDAVRPRPSRSLQDIQRLVDSARGLLYGGQNERGLELVRNALSELDRASPQVNPWPVTSTALLVQSQLFKNLGRTKEMNEAYRRVLRIDPTFTLDPDAYPPSTLQAFEAVRREINRARKYALQVSTSPPGASVFVDGKELGQTPVKLELTSGFYRVSLMDQGRVSFPRRMDPRKESALQVDMRYEGAVSQQPPLCITTESDDDALKLAAELSADEVIVVRNTAQPGNPPYVTAVSYDSTARQLRNGGAGPDMVSNLATFIVTGKEQAGVRPVGAEPPKPEPAAPTKSPDEGAGPIVTTGTGAPSSSDRAGGPPIPPPPPPPPSDVDLSGQVSPARYASYSAVAGGIVATVGGAIVYVLGGTDRDRLAALTTGDGRLYPDGSEKHAEAMALIPQIDANRTLSFTLIGAGVGVAAAGALGLWLLPAEQAHLAVVPTGEGGLVTLSGRF
jgi:hypothetical protein